MLDVPPPPATENPRRNRCFAETLARTPVVIDKAGIVPARPGRDPSADREFRPWALCRSLR